MVQLAALVPRPALRWAVGRPGPAGRGCRALVACSREGGPEIAAGLGVAGPVGRLLVEAHPLLRAGAGRLPALADRDVGAEGRLARRAPSGEHIVQAGQAQLPLSDRALAGPQPERADEAGDSHGKAERGRRALAQQGKAAASVGGPAGLHVGAVLQDGRGHREQDLRTQKDPRRAAEDEQQHRAPPRLRGLEVGARGVLRHVRRRNPDNLEERPRAPCGRCSLPSPAGGPAVCGGALSRALQLGRLGRLERLQRRVRWRHHGAGQAGAGEAKA
mmetsp:Transcript_59872/g.134695  ORF Transcript_59872/g.134695 Transcript_59872/m.134695 type:complete len:274 (+) Transcript_59872:583-1404(+)